MDNKLKTKRRSSSIYGLGIDAGGTFTDAVILDMHSGIIKAQSKANTTAQAPAAGIRQTLTALPNDMLAEITFVSLATTFATNAVVEEKGGKAGLILIGYDEKHPKLSKLSPLLFIEGGHDCRGKEVASLALGANKQKILEFMKNIDAVAVSGHFSIRNPEHELQVAEFINSNYSIPTVCGHLLTGRLDALVRAATAWWNARLIPLISRLIEATQCVLSEFDIQKPLMVVRGDGTVMSAQEARRRPVETLLSGPAASILGAKFLSGLNDGLVVDMGGTTTDMAILKNGKVEIDPEGARVGRWKTHVEAARIQTCGLGGDSIIWTGDGTMHDLRTGPERVQPLCVFAQQYPEILKILDNQIKYSDRVFSRIIHPCTVYVKPENIPGYHELLSKIPVGKLFHEPELYMDNTISITPWQLKEFERHGSIIRASLTPTDFCVAAGRYDLGDKAGAQLGISAFAKSIGVDEDRLCVLVQEMIEKRLCLQAAEYLTGKDAEAVSSLVHRWFPINDFQFDERLGVKFDLKLADSVIGIGAPAKAWLPNAFQHLHAQCIHPEQFLVGTAVGAAVGNVGFTLEATITPDQLGCFTLYTTDGAEEFHNMDNAIKTGRKKLELMATERMANNNVQNPMLNFSAKKITVEIAEGDLHLSTLLQVNAVGKFYNETIGP